jgi:uncharacterized protein (DUF427 family)
MSNPSPGFARNPQKSITVAPHAGTVTVSAAGVMIARSDAALMLTESPYPPVIYIPFSDIDFSKLSRTSHTTYCPYKGAASYWSITPAGPAGENAMWAYQSPYEEAAAIRDHGAFYPDRVTLAT